MLNNFFFLIGEMITSSFALAVSYYIKSRRPPYKSLGYCSRRAQSSEPAWDLAQVTFGKIAAPVFGVYTALTLIAGVVCLSMNFDKKTGLVVFVAHSAVLVTLFIIVIAVVEKKLAEAFDENGNHKGGGL